MIREYSVLLMSLLIFWHRTQGLRFLHFPYLLTLQLKRFDFDYTTMHRIKLNDRMTFPEELDMSPFIDVEDEVRAPLNLPASVIVITDLDSSYGMPFNQFWNSFSPLWLLKEEAKQTLPLHHLRIMGFVLSCGAFIVGLYVFPKQCNLSFISPQKHFSKCWGSRCPVCNLVLCPAMTGFSQP